MQNVLFLVSGVFCSTSIIGAVACSSSLLVLITVHGWILCYFIISIFYSLFIHSAVDGHLVICRIRLLWTLSYMSFMHISIALCWVYTQKWIAGLWRRHLLSLTRHYHTNVGVSVSTASSAYVASGSTSSPTLTIASLSHSGGFVVPVHCGFNLHFSAD